jgi:putative tricarboxylic transport membrane protein
MSAEVLLQACVAGLGFVFSPSMLLFLLAGVVIGGLVGILPGLGGAATIALLLPFVFDQPTHQAFALLIGIVSVTATTGDLTSILLGVPGEATAAATVVDGHPMARRGEAGRAIGASLASSLGGALFGALTLGIGIVAARPLARALGSPEFFMLAVLGVSFAVPLTSTARLKGLAAGGLGLALATVGLDPFAATPRFTFGQMVLWDGLGLIPAALALFAIPEIVSLASRTSIAPLSATPDRATFMDGVRDARRLWPVVLRSSAIGTVIGLLPGLGASVSQWIAYADAAKRSTNAREFGCGAIEGVIAPSAANNATLGGALVPTLALGIPGSLSTAMLLSALIVKGVVPGPQLLAPEREGGHLAFVFALAWMMVFANLIAAVASWGASGLLIGITRLRSGVLVPILLLLVFVGAFVERHLLADLLIMVAVAAVGLALYHFRWPRSPVLIGLVLGGLAENRLFLSMDAYGAAWLLRPGVLAIAFVIAASFVYPFVRRRPASNHAAGAPGESSSALGHGELAFVVVLLVIVLAALLLTADFAGRAALFPRLVLGVTAGLLSSIIIRDRILGGRGMPLAAPSSDRMSFRAVSFVPVFVLLIWALGFTPGAPAAVLIYLIAGGRERLGTVAAVTLAVFLLIEMIMVRLLQLPFPVGAILAWAGVGA